MMRPTTKMRLAQAYDLVGDLAKIGYSSSEIISELVNHYGAAHGHDRHCGYFLRCATVKVYSVSMVDRALLTRWMDKAATVLGMTERLAA